MQPGNEADELHATRKRAPIERLCSHLLQSWRSRIVPTLHCSASEIDNTHSLIAHEGCMLCTHALNRCSLTNIAASYMSAIASSLGNIYQVAEQEVCMQSLSHIPMHTVNTTVSSLFYVKCFIQGILDSTLVQPTEHTVCVPAVDRYALPRIHIEYEGILACIYGLSAPAPDHFQ